MSNAQQNKTPERKSGIIMPIKDFDASMTDNRMGMRRGCARDCCGQMGLTAKKRDGAMLIEGPRDRLQMLVEILHFSHMKYAIAY